MQWDIISANITSHLEFSVTFTDGLTGRVKLLPTHLYGVFAPLSDPAFFKRLQVVDGFVTWPGDIDLAPDAMYEAIQRDGAWLLD